MRGDDRLNFVLMRPGGRVVRARVSRGCLVLALLFFAAFVAASIWTINHYYDAASENRRLRAERDRLTRSIEEYSPTSEDRTEFENLAARLENAESAEDPAGAADMEIENPAPSELTVPAVEPPAEAPPEETPAPPEEITIEVPEPRVEISELSITPNPSAQSLNTRFKLQKIEQGQAAVQGYIVAVLKNSQADPPGWLVFPEGVELDRGAPKDFKQGEFFSIRSHKVFDLTIRKAADPKSFTKAVVYAFDEEGRPIGKLEADPGR